MTRNLGGALVAGALVVGAVLWGCTQGKGPAALAADAITASAAAQKLGVSAYVLGTGDLIATVYDENGTEMGQVTVTDAGDVSRIVTYSTTDGTTLSTIVERIDASKPFAGMLHVETAFQAVEADPALTARFRDHSLRFLSAADHKFVANTLEPEGVQTCGATDSTAVKLNAECFQYDCTQGTATGTYTTEAGTGTATQATCTTASGAYCDGYDTATWDVGYAFCTCGFTIVASLTMHLGCYPTSGTTYSPTVSNNCVGEIDYFLDSRTCGANSCVNANGAHTCTTPQAGSFDGMLVPVTVEGSPPYQTDVQLPTCPYWCAAGAFQRNTGSPTVDGKCADGSNPVPGILSGGQCTYNGSTQPATAVFIKSALYRL